MTISGWGEDFVREGDKLDCRAFIMQVLRKMDRWQMQMLLARIVRQVRQWFGIYGVKMVQNWVFVCKDH